MMIPAPNARPVPRDIQNMASDSILTPHISFMPKMEVTVNGQYVVVAEKRPSFCNITEALLI